MSENFLHAAEKVYKKSAARWPFRELFKRKIKEDIRKDDFDSFGTLFYALETRVAAGGELAIDIAKVIMEICTERIEICWGKLPNAQYAERDLVILHMAKAVLRAKIDAADVLFKDIE
ncbi:hypothetical protein GJ744_008315 [Endocarpon pusillum]|uniref:Uncharacterized protein n=1 Tax=Endocarpon pusillum TaxID=364733 RepID=A0A8H7AH90_9EURO|nr:hypothetical protein GJ744_008315 [Endocarpon pusillum]